MDILYISVFGGVFSGFQDVFMQDDGVVQWVPIEWLQLGTSYDLLLDNVLHQAPYPTVHLIRRDALKGGSEDFCERFFCRFCFFGWSQS